jgi:hypothetical protein
MTAPQLVMIILLALGTGIHLALHGQPRSPYRGDFALVGLCLNLGLLWWGGFFG